jgi:hypothetical protein
MGEWKERYLALRTRGGISTSNSTGRPRKPSKRSTGVPDLHLPQTGRGGRILIVFPHPPPPPKRFVSCSIRHATTDLLTAVSSDANTDSCWLSHSAKTNGRAAGVSKKAAWAAGRGRWGSGAAG